MRSKTTSQTKNNRARQAIRRFFALVDKTLAAAEEAKRAREELDRLTTHDRSAEKHVGE